MRLHPGDGPMWDEIKWAKCNNLVGPDQDVPCDGVLAFYPGDREAPCSACGARCGSMVADYFTFETLPKDQWVRCKHCGAGPLEQFGKFGWGVEFVGGKRTRPDHSCSWICDGATYRHHAPEDLVSEEEIAEAHASIAAAAAALRVTHA